MEAVRAAPTPPSPRRPRAARTPRIALPPNGPLPTANPPASPQPTANRPPIRTPPSWRPSYYFNRSTSLHNPTTLAAPQVATQPVPHPSVNSSPQPPANQPGSPRPLANPPPFRRPPSWSPRDYFNQSTSLHTPTIQAASQMASHPLPHPPINHHPNAPPLSNQPDSPRPTANQPVVVPRPPKKHRSSPRTAANQAASQVAQQASQPGGERVRGGGGQRQTQDPPNGVARIHVSGFPVYAQSQDLVTCFSKFGQVRVEKMTNKYAFLAYSTAEEARAAIQASKKVIVYGEFLTVREFAAAPPELPQPPHKAAPRRDFRRSKEKGEIVEPKQIDLSGDFEAQMESILARVRLTQEEAAAIGLLYADVEKVLQAVWPGCVAMPFGSITTGLGIKSSDADCYVRLPDTRRSADPQHVNRAKRILESYPGLFAEILSIPRANTPIVKFFHMPTETNCDLTFKTPLGSQNSKLIAFLLHADPRLIPVAVTIKYWAKVHGLSGTGKLTNYALTMMIIFYLQQPPMSILPSVEWLQRDRRNDVIVDYWNTGFMANMEQWPASSNTSSVSELLGGFFEFYSTFNFDEMVVCPYLGAPIKKAAFGIVNQLPDAFQRYKHNVLQGIVYPMRNTTAMCVQDPFEQSHNVASAISGRLAAEIKAYLTFAANAYEKDKLKNCREFLKIILLEKPKLPKAKPQEFRVNLFPRLMMNIKGEDWRSIVRQVISTIFETMLKIKLSKAECKVSPASKKVKERYTGTVTKAIWKRKQFSRIYIAMNLDFKQKQTRITEEIMEVEKESLNIPFLLMITYTSDPRSVNVTIKQAEGDNELFKEFGRLFISVFQNWFVALLKPEAKPPAIDNAAKIAETIQIVDGTNEPNTSVDSDDISVVSETTNSQESASENDSAVTNSDAVETQPDNNASEKDDNASEKDNNEGEKDNNANEKDNDAIEKDNDTIEKDNDASDKAEDSGVQGKQ